MCESCLLYTSLWNNPSFDYYDTVDNTNSNGYYIERGEIRLDNTKMCMYSIRFIYDDGGYTHVDDRHLFGFNGFESWFPWKNDYGQD